MNNFTKTLRIFALLAFALFFIAKFMKPELEKTFAAISILIFSVLVLSSIFKVLRKYYL